MEKPTSLVSTNVASADDGTLIILTRPSQDYLNGHAGMYGKGSPSGTSIPVCTKSL